MAVFYPSDLYYLHLFNFNDVLSESDAGTAKFLPSRLPIVIPITGKARHGKDTAARLLSDAIHKQFPKANVSINHYGDYLKYICSSRFGWNGNKDDYGRSLLQRVGTDLYRNYDQDFWVNSLCDSMMPLVRNFNQRPPAGISVSMVQGVPYPDFVIVPDTRFPNEIFCWLARGFFTMPINVLRLEMTPEGASTLNSENMGQLILTKILQKSDQYITDFDNGLTTAAKTHVSENALNEYTLNENIRSVVSPSELISKTARLGRIFGELNCMLSAMSRMDDESTSEYTERYRGTMMNFNSDMVQNDYEIGRFSFLKRLFSMFMYYCTYPIHNVNGYQDETLERGINDFLSERIIPVCDRAGISPMLQTDDAKKRNDGGRTNKPDSGSAAGGEKHENDKEIEAPTSGNPYVFTTDDSYQFPNLINNPMTPDDKNGNRGDNGINKKRNPRKHEKPGGGNDVKDGGNPGKDKKST